MNKHFCLAIVILSVLAVSTIGCKKGKKYFTPQITIIDGNISELIHSPFVIFRGKTDEIYITNSNNNSFIFKDKLSQAGIYSIVLDSISKFFYLEPGDHISLEFSDLQTFEIVSNHNYENNFLQEFLTYKKALIKDSMDQVFMLSENNFMKKIEDYTQNLVNFQQEFQKKHEPFNEVFADIIIDEIAYDAAILKLRYPEKYNELLPDSVLILSDTYDTFLQNMELDDDQMLLVPSFRDFLKRYVEFYVHFDTDIVNDTTSNTPLIQQQFEFISKNFRNQYIKNYLYYKFMLIHFPNVGIEFYEQYTELQKDNYYLEVIKKMKQAFLMQNN